MLNGLRRAVVDTAFPWKLVDPSPAGISPTAADLEHITSAATYDWDISSEEGRISLASIQRYQASLKGLSAGLVPLGVLECRQAYLASALAPGPSSRRWEGLVSYPVESVMPEGGDPSVQSCLDEALALFDQTLALLEDDELVAPMDPYAFDILLETIVSRYAVLPPSSLTSFARITESRHARVPHAQVARCQAHDHPARSHGRGLSSHRRGPADWSDSMSPNPESSVSTPAWIYRV